MRKYTRDLYARLEAETGQSTGLRQVGFIEVATDADRLEEYRRVSAFNRYCGVDVHEISPGEVEELFPLGARRRRARRLLRRRGRPGQPGRRHDGAGQGRAACAARRSSRACRSRDVLHRRGGGGRPACGRRSATSRPSTSSTAPACGRASSARGRGVTIPLQAAEHYYLITEAIDGVDADLPVLEDPAAYGYFREEVGGLMVGLFEPVCAPWKVDGIPEDFSFGELPPDWDRMAPYLEKAMRACRSRWRPASGSSSAARRASRPTCSRSSARRPS